jgi:rRNA maturation endonuclease Nob1
MMKRLAFLFPVFLILLLIGCVDIEVRTRIEDDGSGKQNWKFVTTALLASELKKQITSDPFFSRHGNFKDEFKQGDYILSMEIPFDKVEELKSPGHEVRFQRSGFFKTTCMYSETWRRNVQDKQSLLAKRAESIVPVTLKVSVLMPGKIVDSNAETVDDSTARWNLSLQDISEQRLLTATSKHWNIAMLISLIMFLSTAAALALLLLSPAVKRKRQLTCPACNREVPEGSSFCNRCGANLQPPAEKRLDKPTAD